MRNIKLSFEHPYYIYPFKLSLTTPATGGDLQRINFKNTQQTVERIKKEVILTTEQEKVISSLSIVFKSELISEYTKRLNERKQFDYLGQFYSQHFTYFQKMCRQKITLKELLQLKHYIYRTAQHQQNQSQTNSNQRSMGKGKFESDQWLDLLLLFFTNFISVHYIHWQGDEHMRQLQIFIALFVLIECTNHLLLHDLSFGIQLHKLIVRLQDMIVQTYLKVSNIQFQEQIVIQLFGLVKTVIHNLKIVNQRNQQNPERKQSVHVKKHVNSVIFWIINFTAQQKLTSKHEIAEATLNPYTILQLVIKLLGKSVNILVIESCLLFIIKLFQQVSLFGELLFLITEAIRFGFPKMLDAIMNKIRGREFRSNQVVRLVLQCDLFDFLGKSTIEPFKLKQMTKIQKPGEKVFNASLRDVNKLATQLTDEFARYKKGKVRYRHLKKVQGVLQQEIEQRQILNIQKLAEESHLHLKSHEILSMQLYRENQELIKVNRWLQSKLKQKEQVISELLNINSKLNIQSKLTTVSSTINITIASRAINQNKPNCCCSNTKNNHNPLNNNANNDNHHGMHRNQSLKDLLQQHNHKSNRGSRTDQNSKLNIPVISLNNSHSETVLVQIPRIQVHTRRNSISLKQQELNLSAIIYQNASTLIHQSIKDSQKHMSTVSFLPPPLPPPPSLDINSLNQILPPLPPPPPAFLFDGMLPSPPPLLPFLLPPPPLLPQRKSMNFNQLKDQQKLEMKNIGWSLLDSTKLKNTFWESINRNPIVLNEQQIVKYFSKIDKNYVAPKSTVAEVKTILKADRIKNIQIVLKKMKITQQSFPFICQFLNTYDRCYINQQFLIGLLNLQATQKQKDDYLEILIDQEEKWTLADKFLCFVSKIDSYEQKISSILFKEEFNQISTVFFQKLHDFVYFYEQLHGDRFFHAFLQIFLSVGNYLNFKTARGNAKAFRIQNIQKSYHLLAQDKQTTLFEYILEVMYRKQPQLFDYQTLTQKQKAIVSLNILTDDYAYFETKCDLISHCILLSQDNEIDQSAEFFLPFYMEAREQVSMMKKRLEESTATFRSVKEYYGDKLQSEEMYKFITDFRKRVIQFKSKRLKKRRQDCK